MDGFRFCIHLIYWPHKIQRNIVYSMPVSGRCEAFCSLEVLSDTRFIEDNENAIVYSQTTYSQHLHNYNRYIK